MIKAVTVFDEKGPAIKEASLKLINEIKELKISSDDDEQVAINAREKVRVCLKRIDELREAEVKPLRDEVSSINTQAKFYSEPLKEAFNAVTLVIKDYMDEKAEKAEAEARRVREEQAERDRIERDKLKAAQRAEEEARHKALEAARKAEEATTKKARDAANKKAEEARIKAEEEAAKAAKAQEALDTREVALVDAPKKTVRTSSGAKVTRKMEWTFKVIDWQRLMKERPDLFLINESLINKMIREGEREIPGLEIYQESQISA